MPDTPQLAGLAPAPIMRFLLDSSAGRSTRSILHRRFFSSIRWRTSRQSAKRNRSDNHGRLAMRPIGALLFGLLADRYGRRIPLMANVIYFSVIELMCGFFAQLHGVHHPPRAVWHRHGWRMGRWRVARDGSGAGALEGHPQRNLAERLFDRISAGGDCRKVSLAGVGMAPMFWIGALPALLALYIRTKVPESEAWKQHRAASTGQVLRIVAGEWKRFSYLVVLMTFMMFLSHGTQIFTRTS